jgi:hypothetical protein
MPSKPPRFLPTLALAVLWLALYFVWVAVRPAAEPGTATQTRGRTAVTSSTTTTTVAPLFKLKP